MEVTTKKKNKSYSGSRTPEPATEAHSPSGSRRTPGRIPSAVRSQAAKTYTPAPSAEGPDRLLPGLSPSSSPFSPRPSPCLALWSRWRMVVFFFFFGRASGTIWSTMGCNFTLHSTFPLKLLSFFFHLRPPNFCFLAPSLPPALTLLFLLLFPIFGLPA